MKVKIIKKDKYTPMWYNILVEELKDLIYEVEECPEEESNNSYKLKNQPLYINKEHCEIIKDFEEEFENLHLKIEELKDSFMEGEAEKFLDELYNIGKKAIQYYKEK